VFAVAERFAVVDIVSVHVDIIGQGIAANAFVLLAPPMTAVWSH